jgi:DNA repair protein RecO (recombination protein O)
MAGHLEPLTHSSLLLVRGSSLDIVSQAQTLKSFSGLRLDLGRIASGFYVSEIVDLFTEDGEANSILFQLLLDTLDIMSTIDKDILHLVIHRFEMQLLGLMGYRPQFDTCVANGELLPRDVPLSFSVVWGGLLCDNCSARDGTARKISSRGVTILKILQRGNMEAVEGIEMTKGARNALSGLLRWYIQSILEREVQSGSFLDSLQ